MGHRRVRFDEENPGKNCTDIPHFYENERQLLWYTAQELRGFREQIRALRKNPLMLDESKDSWRGLETWMAKEFRTSRRDYIRYVIDIQLENHRRSIHDPIGVGTLAMAQSSNALERARFYGIRDSVEALQLYQEPAELKSLEVYFFCDHHGSVSRPEIPEIPIAKIV